MAAADGNKCFIAIETEVFNEVTMQLSEAQAMADVVANLAGQGDIESLCKGTMSAYLFHLHDQLAIVYKRLAASAKPLAKQALTDSSNA